MIDALFGMDKYRQRKEIITKYLGLDIEDMMDDTALVMDAEETDEDEEEVSE